MFRKLPVIALAMLTSIGFADTAIIENFQDTDDPANWQISAEPSQTQNASATGEDVPVFETQNPGTNIVGKFTAEWNTASPSAASENPYISSAPATYWAVRYTINAPGSLPNNQIPSASGKLQADVTNDNAYPIQVALAVDSAQSSQLERGPLLTLDANSSATYSWDFATTPPVGFVTGDGVFSGSQQRVKSLLVYTPTQPTTTSVSVTVDDIRNGAAEIVTAPAPAKPVSLHQGPSTGQAIISFTPSPTAGIVQHNIYIASDSDFGTPVINRLTFPATPATTASASANAAVLDGLPTGQDVYVTITAVDNTPQANESDMCQVLAINLSSDASDPSDRIVLDNDAFTPGDSGFLANGYFNSVVYTAQALDGLGRTFDTTTANAVADNTDQLTPDPEGIVVWSNLQDGIMPGTSVSPDAQNVISDFIANDGNLILSGSAVAQDLGTQPGVLESVLKSSLVSGDITASTVVPSTPVLSVDPFSTALNPATNSVAYSTSANDGIFHTGGSVPLANYENVPKANAVAGIGYNASLVFLGFAFETAGDAAGPSASATVRQKLMGALVNYLLGETAANNWEMFP